MKQVGEEGAWARLKGTTFESLLESESNQPLRKKKTFWRQFGI